MSIHKTVRTPVDNGWMRAFPQVRLVESRLPNKRSRTRSWYLRPGPGRPEGVDL